MSNDQITCNICNCTILKRSEAQHLKSKKHIKNLEIQSEEKSISSEEKPVKASIRASRKHYQKHPEYYKEYYQKNKDKWNDYTPKICQCGMTVTSLWKHQKTKLHKKLMELLNNRSTAISSQVSSQSALTT
jgi:hypothetical protein